MGDIIRLEIVADNLITDVRPEEEWPRFLRGNYVPNGNLLRGTLPLLRDIEMYLFKENVLYHGLIEEGLDVNLAAPESLVYTQPNKSRIEEAIDDATVYTVLAFGIMRDEKTFVDMARFPEIEGVKGFTLDQMRFMVTEFLGLHSQDAEMTEARVERYTLGLGLVLKGADVSIVVRDDRADYSTMRTEPRIDVKEIREKLGLDY